MANLNINNGIIHKSYPLKGYTAGAVNINFAGLGSLELTTDYSLSGGSPQPIFTNPSVGGGVPHYIRTSFLPDFYYSGKIRMAANIQYDAIPYTDFPGGDYVGNRVLAWGYAQSEVLRGSSGFDVMLRSDNVIGAGNTTTNALIGAWSFDPVVGNSYGKIVVCLAQTRPSITVYNATTGASIILPHAGVREGWQAYDSGWSTVIGTSFFVGNNTDNHITIT